ncbi:uncharacterized protein DS421_15g523040 [Arachis hypogaea]|nr:uncharacterized protein DS421_15g523040 [Arachis hypogaea]
MLYVDQQPITGEETTTVIGDEAACEMREEASFQRQKRNGHIVQKTMTAEVQGRPPWRSDGIVPQLMICNAARRTGLGVEKRDLCQIEQEAMGQNFNPRRKRPSIVLLGGEWQLAISHASATKLFGGIGIGSIKVGEGSAQKGWYTVFVVIMATMVEENTGNAASQWAILGDDILNMITDRFDDIYDYARFGAVCKPWLSFSHRFYKRKHHLFRANHQLPLLVVPMEGHQEIRGLYNIAKDTLCNQIQLNLPYKRCCGSSHGWLFFVDNKSPQIQLVLINPFASESENSMIKLPPIQCDNGDRVMYMDEYGVNKAVLSKDPNDFPNDFEVIAIYGGIQKLAHYKSGNNFWSYPKPSKHIRSFADVIFHKGMAYAVSSYSWIVRIYRKRYKQSPGGNNSSPCYLRFKTINERLPQSVCNYSGNAYLVETSMGELLHVRRDYITLEARIAKDAELEEQMKRSRAEYEARTQEEHDRLREEINKAIEELEREIENRKVKEYSEPDLSKDLEEELHKYDKPHLSVNFTVFKLNFPSSRGQKSMETLNGEILFVGDNNSVSVPSSRCPTLIPNSIYYTDDFIGIYFHNLAFGSCDTGVFNLENKSFGKHFVPNFSAKGMPPPIFIMPRYRSNAIRIV